MADHIRYDLLTQQALRGVVRAVLIDAAKKGLPGDHHFYIAFDTQAEGVRIPDRLRAQYPEQMTIILQHQFWDLKVTDEEFEVGLSFGGIPAKLTVPFEAVQGLFRPVRAVRPAIRGGRRRGGAARRAGQCPGQARRTTMPVEAKKRLPASPAPVEPEAPAAAAAEPTDEPPASGGAEVVRLDRFRKK